MYIVNRCYTTSNGEKRQTGGKLLLALKFKRVSEPGKENEREGGKAQVVCLESMVFVCNGVS